ARARRRALGGRGAGRVGGDRERDLRRRPGPRRRGDGANRAGGLGRRDALLGGGGRRGDSERVSVLVFVSVRARQAARATIERFIRATLPRGTPDAFTDEELTHSGDALSGPFAPYQARDAGPDGQRDP